MMIGSNLIALKTLGCLEIGLIRRKSPPPHLHSHFGRGGPMPKKNFHSLYQPRYAGPAAAPTTQARFEPTHFDPAYPEQKGEFLAYRAFLDEVRQLPPTSKGENESHTKIGPFEIFTSGDDMRKWGEIWALWEHAHGM